MTYEIYITAAAERDLLRASDHIEFILKNPKAADELLDEADAQINSLADFLVVLRFFICFRKATGHLSCVKDIFNLWCRQ